MKSNNKIMNNNKNNDVIIRKNSGLFQRWISDKQSLHHVGRVGREAVSVENNVVLQGTITRWEPPPAKGLVVEGYELWSRRSSPPPFRCFACSGFGWCRLPERKTTWWLKTCQPSAADTSAALRRCYRITGYRYRLRFSYRASRALIIRYVLISIGHVR